MPIGLWKTVQLILDNLLQNEDVETGMEIYSQFHSSESMSGKDIDSFTSPFNLSMGFDSFRTDD